MPYLAKVFKEASKFINMGAPDPDPDPAGSNIPGSGVDPDPR